MVQGHVDTVAEIVDVRADGRDCLTFRLRPRLRRRRVRGEGGDGKDNDDIYIDEEEEEEKGGGGGGGETDVMRYVVEKGYVALDGASLTVTRVGGGEGRPWFEVMLITYTQEKVVMAKKIPGDEVNVEVDMVGKYVEKSVRGYLDGMGGDGEGVLEKMVGRMVEEKLKGGL